MYQGRLNAEKYSTLFDVFKRGTEERHPQGGALQRDDKGKTYYYDKI